MNEREQLLARIKTARDNVETSKNPAERAVWVRLYNKYVTRLNRMKRST